MTLAFPEHYRVLRNNRVITVKFNYKESGVWDVLAICFIDAAMKITASWAVISLELLGLKGH